MLLFAHSGHDHGATHDTLGATTSDGSGQGLLVAIGVILIVVAVIGTVYFLRQRNKEAAEKTS